jgi:hypothetical protein
MNQSSHPQLTSAGVIAGESLLLALIPPVGRRPDVALLTAFIKVAEGSDLIIHQSEITFTDAAGNIMEFRNNAFQLEEGIHFTGPCLKALEDHNRRPESAARFQWRINDLSVEGNITFSEEEWHLPRVVCLPLQVALECDCHFIVSIVNTGIDLLNISEGVRNALLHVDGISYDSIAGRSWNGIYLIQSGRSYTQRFRLLDFPGAPRNGSHEVSLEMFGRRSVTQTVDWLGRPWYPEINSTNENR